MCTLHGLVNCSFHVPSQSRGTSRFQFPCEAARIWKAQGWGKGCCDGGGSRTSPCPVQVAEPIRKGFRFRIVDNYYVTAALKTQQTGRMMQALDCALSWRECYNHYHFWEPNLTWFTSTVTVPSPGVPKWSPLCRGCQTPTGKAHTKEKGSNNPCEHHLGQMWLNLFDSFPWSTQFHRWSLITETC